MSEENIKAVNVLVVDDEPIITNLFEKYLKRAGSGEVQSANSGSEAFEKLASFSADVVLMDYVMPGPDGVSTATAIKALYGIPCVFVTAYANKLKREHGIEGGEVLEKPVKEPGKLWHAISVAIRTHVACEWAQGKFYFGTDPSGRVLGLSLGARRWLGSSAFGHAGFQLKQILSETPVPRASKAEIVNQLEAIRWTGKIRNPKGFECQAKLESSPVVLGSDVMGFRYSVELLGKLENDPDWANKNLERLELLRASILEKRELDAQQAKRLKELQAEARARIASSRRLSWSALKEPRTSQKMP